MAYLNGNKVFLYGERTVDANLTTKTIKQNGTYNASSDNADGYSSVTIDVPPADDYYDDKYFCRVLNYDGTVLAMEYLNNGDEFILPDFPEDSDMALDRWVGSQAINSRVVDGKVQYYITINGLDFIAGPLVYTKDDTDKLGIKLDQTTGLYIKITFRSFGTATVNWGDGTIDNYTNTLVYEHTYQSYGEYEISISNWGAIIENGIFGQLNVNDPDRYKKYRILQYIKKKRCNNVTPFGTSTQHCTSLKYIAHNSNTRTDNFISLGNYMDVNIIPYDIISGSTLTVSSSSYTSCARNLIIENGYSKISGEFHLYGVDYFVLPKTITDFEGDYFGGITTYKPKVLRIYAVNAKIGDVYCDKIVFGNTVKKCAINKLATKKLVLPDTLEEIVDAPRYTSDPINNIGKPIPNLPSSLTSISSFGYICDIGVLEVPSCVTAIPNSYILQNSKCVPEIKRINFKGSITTIGSNSFNSLENTIFDFTNNIVVPSLSGVGAFSTYGRVIILVPSSLYNQWISATNWVSLAKFIIPMTV